MTPLAATLKRLREALPMTQEALGAAVGIKQTAISRYEKGKTLPDLLSLLKLATGLKVPLEVLVEGVDVRFDAVYKGLHVNITTPEDDPEENGTEAAVDSSGALPIDVIVPGAPVPAVADDQVPDLAATHAALTRLASELMAVASRLPTRSHSVARPVGSPVRPRDARRRTRPRQKPPTKAPSKRR